MPSPEVIDKLGPLAVAVFNEETTQMLREYYAGRITLVDLHDRWNALTGLHNALISSVQPQPRPAAPPPVVQPAAQAVPQQQPQQPAPVIQTGAQPPVAEKDW